MKEGTSHSEIFSPFTQQERFEFEKMMSEIQVEMRDVHMENARMSREAERASTMAFLNC